MILAAKRPVDGSFRVGTDVVELPRLRAHILRHGAALLGRLFTRDEVTAAETAGADVVAILGAALAIKKAFLGVIDADGRIPLTDIEVTMEGGAWSAIRLHGVARARAAAQGLTLADLATARSGHVATATVIVRADLVSGNWQAIAS
jgi:phosphopantetheine--protein transferase-like protein